MCRTDHETSCTTRLDIDWPSWDEMPSIAHYVSSSTPAPCHSTGMWSKHQASLLVTQNVRRWEFTFFEGKDVQVQELIFRSKNGRNQFAHNFSFLSKVPLEVCGQGCVTEEAPEEWSSLKSSPAFVPLCLCALIHIIRISFHLSLFRTNGQQTSSEYFQL